jgi:hypothetical protein
VIATLISISPPAHAGFKGNLNVTADPVNRFANGAIGSVRNSADASQYIYCYATHATSANAFCVARDIAGTAVSCFTTDPNKVALVSAMTSYSYIYFSFDTSGTCTQLLVENASYYPPMVP